MPRNYLYFDEEMPSWDEMVPDEEEEESEPDVETRAMWDGTICDDCPF